MSVEKHVFKRGALTGRSLHQIGVTTHREAAKPHGQESDLHLLAQKEGESLRKYIQRFSRVQYNIPDVHPAAVISAFHQNV